MATTHALITGGASGIGRATALAFAREGACVTVADSDVAGGEETVRRIVPLGVEAVFAEVDVASEADVAQLLETAVERFGPPNAAVNCAGVEMATDLTADCPLDEWRRVLAINLTGTFLCVKAQLSAMLTAEEGAIVNVSSIAGVVGLRGQVAYAASKHGVIGLSKTAALEYAHLGLRVNAICPGPVDTPLARRGFAHRPEGLEAAKAHVPANRIAAPEEIAALAVWLCTDAAAFINGQAIPVDGGMTAQ